MLNLLKAVNVVYYTSFRCRKVEKVDFLLVSFAFESLKIFQHFTTHKNVVRVIAYNVIICGLNFTPPENGGPSDRVR